MGILMIRDFNCELCTVFSGSISVYWLFYCIVFGSLSNTEGYHIMKRDIPDFWIWLYYINPYHYPYFGACYQEFSTVEGFDDVGYFKNGQDVIDQWGYDEHTIPVYFLYSLLLLFVGHFFLSIIFYY